LGDSLRISTVGWLSLIGEKRPKWSARFSTGYNSGWGYNRITNELNARGIKPKVKSKWQVISVQRLIQNPIYCGDFFRLLIFQFVNILTSPVGQAGCLMSATYM
jgi:hypothetical protein